MEDRGQWGVGISVLHANWMDHIVERVRFKGSVNVTAYNILFACGSDLRFGVPILFATYHFLDSIINKLFMTTSMCQKLSTTPYRTSRYQLKLYFASGV